MKYRIAVLTEGLDEGPTWDKIKAKILPKKKPGDDDSEEERRKQMQAMMLVTSKDAENVVEALLSEWSPTVGNRWEYIFSSEEKAREFAHQVKSTGLIRGSIKVAPTNGWKTWSVTFPRLTQMRDVVDFNTKVKYTPEQPHFEDILKDLKDRAR